MGSEVDVEADISAVGPDPAVVTKDVPPFREILKVVVSLLRLRPGLPTWTVTPEEVVSFAALFLATAVRI